MKTVTRERHVNDMNFLSSLLLFSVNQKRQTEEGDTFLSYPSAQTETNICKPLRNVRRRITAVLQNVPFSQSKQVSLGFGTIYPQKLKKIHIREKLRTDYKNNSMELNYKEIYQTFLCQQLRMGLSKFLLCKKAVIVQLYIGTMNLKNVVQGS